MQTWIFQGNPDRFDIDTYLAAWLPEFPWLVKQKQFIDTIKKGDKVFIWRAAGREKSIAGIVAEAVITGEPKPRPEDDFGKTLWRQGSAEGQQELVRALLRPIRVASAREVLKLEWMKEDPLLRSLGIVKLPRQTNYKIEPQYAARLELLWSRIGQDWTRDEALAGLWAYAKTRGGSVSKLPGSPVADVALAIGRPVSGVYIKVLNFRSLDPNNPGGMSSVSETDRRVWAEFTDQGTAELKQQGIEDEFTRLWRLPSRMQGVPVTAEVSAGIARRLEVENLSTLIARYSVARAARPERPAVGRVEARAFERDPLAVAITRKRAKFRCEIPDCRHPTFTTADGIPYCEAHHIVPLNEGGRDVIENMACVCPAHHREAHWGVDRAAIAAALLKVRSMDS